ncbi:MAG: hypothetical protein AAB459_03255 [Patescibacteria group bacterium]
MHKQNLLINNQQGIVAFVITIIVMIIIVITTVSMSVIANRESKQALDRQLSTQAFYAAESGINDTVDYIRDKIRNNQPVTDITDCSTGTTGTSAVNIANDQANNLNLDSTFATLLNTQATSKYTCVLVSTSPNSLEYLQINSDNSSTVNDITFTGANQATKLVIGWEHYLGGSVFRTGTDCGKFPSASGWLAAPLLKADVTVLEGSNFTRSDLLARTASYYLDPCAGSGNTTENFTPGINSNGNGKILSGVCQNSAPNTAEQPRKCNVTINFSAYTPPSGPIGGNVTNILVRIKPVYETARVSINALDGLNNRLNIVGGQIVIDVTGKVNDVLKRTQVRVSNRTPYLYAVESPSGVCKRFLAVEPPENSVNNSRFSPNPSVCNINEE